MPVNKNIKAYLAQNNCRYYTMKGFLLEPAPGEHGRVAKDPARPGHVRFYLIKDGVPDTSKFFPVPEGYLLRLAEQGAPRKRGRKKFKDTRWWGWARDNRKVMEELIELCRRRGCFFIDRQNYIRVGKDSDFKFEIWRGGQLGFAKRPTDPLIAKEAIDSGYSFARYHVPLEVLDKTGHLAEVPALIERILSDKDI